MNDSKTRIGLKVAIFALAIIGGIAVLGAIGMAIMHFEMMGSIRC